MPAKKARDVSLTPGTGHLRRAASPRIDRAVETHAIELTTIERAYFTSEGLLTPRTRDFWRKAGEQAVAEGFGKHVEIEVASLQRLTSGR